MRHSGRLARLEDRRRQESDPVCAVVSAIGKLQEEVERELAELRKRYAGTVIIVDR